MSFIDKAFSVHDDAMMLRSRRSSVLAANIANADTPNYKARDMDFSSMLQQAQSGQQNQMQMAKTSTKHLSVNASSTAPEIKYRNPLHASLDGNTVDMHVEQAKFSENALQYQSSLNFLSGKIRGMLLAIKGQ